MTRRSAGFPLVLTALLKATEILHKHEVKNKPSDWTGTFSYTIERLISFIPSGHREAGQGKENITYNLAAHIHSLNILRVFVRDNTLGDTYLTLDSFF